MRQSARFLRYHRKNPIWLSILLGLLTQRHLQTENWLGGWVKVVVNGFSPTWRPREVAGLFWSVVVSTRLRSFFDPPTAEAMHLVAALHCWINILQNRFPIAQRASFDTKLEKIRLRWLSAQWRVCDGGSVDFENVPHFCVIQCYTTQLCRHKVIFDRLIDTAKF